MPKQNLDQDSTHQPTYQIHIAPPAESTMPHTTIPSSQECQPPSLETTPPSPSSSLSPIDYSSNYSDSDSDQGWGAQDSAWDSADEGDDEQRQAKLVYEAYIPPHHQNHRKHHEEYLMSGALSEEDDRCMFGKKECQVKVAAGLVKAGMGWRIDVPDQKGTGTGTGKDDGNGRAVRETTHARASSLPGRTIVGQ